MTMHDLPMPRILMSLVLMGLTLLAAAADSPTKREDPGRAAGPQAASYVGVVTCARCHTAPTAEDLAPSPNGKTTDRVRLTEYVTWSKEDKHQLAYTTISRERGGERVKRMNRLLSYGGKTFEATTSASCLSCHAIDCQTRAHEKTFNVTRGVSCEACHGPASLWIDPHWKADWREKAAEEKQALGMKNLRDPVEQVRVCLSCHVGNSREGKLVTHEMYAAGHPPLPGFEIATFTEEMPRHWDPHPPEPFYRTRLVVVGGVVALRETVQLLADEAAVHVEKSKRSWPELSLYDCRACHHDLRVPSWRQQRGYAIAPGRPLIRAWAMPLAELGLVIADPQDSSLEKLLRPLYQALDQQAFGRPNEVARAAQEILPRLDRVITTLRQTRYDGPAASGLLVQICRLAAARKVRLRFGPANCLELPGPLRGTPPQVAARCRDPEDPWPTP